MLPYMILENIFIIFSILFIVVLVRSQTTSDYLEQPSRFRTCSSSSYCIPIRRCLPLREGWKRRGVGITCGYGIGPYRLVCCPRSQEIEAPVRQTKRPRTTTPAPTTDTGSSEDCGTIQEMDWFREHTTNDTDALEATWPWMAAIRKVNSSGSSRPWCSGFLIDKVHVLSAAHCFSRWKDGNFSASIGSDDQNLAEEYPVSEIKLHEGYQNNFMYHDIAILTLEREVDVSNFVPVCLPDDRIAEMDLTGRGATLVGWGKETREGPVSDTLKQLDDIPIVSNEECNRIFEKLNLGYAKMFYRGITKDMFCTGQTESSRHSCGGDSGGPVMILYKRRWFAVGLISFGYSCGTPGVPNGNTRISNHMDWIRENTENLTMILPR